MPESPSACRPQSPRSRHARDSPGSIFQVSSPLAAVQGCFGPSGIQRARETEGISPTLPKLPAT
jgi:hypothetical protein